MLTIHHGFSQVSFLDFFHNYNYNFYSLQSQSDFQVPRINFEKNRVRTILWTSNLEKYSFGNKNYSEC